MTPQQQQVVESQPLPSIITQKVQLTYKLFLLENARNALEQELLNFTSKAYEEVQGFLNSSFPTSMFGDLAKALDSKCQAIDKLSALVKDLTVAQRGREEERVQDGVGTEGKRDQEPVQRGREENEETEDGEREQEEPKPQLCVKNGLRTNQLQPLRDKGILMADVLKFGPMLQNTLMASSIAKVAQVLGATLFLQQSKHFLLSRPAAIQQEDMICSIPSSYSSAVATSRSSSPLKAEKKEHTVVYEEERPPDAAILPPAIIHSPKISAKRPPILLPPIQAIFPEISNPKPMKIAPLIGWGYENDVQVQHQKQTSSQLLHFLRAKAKNMGALEVTVTAWTSSSPQSMSPPVKTQSYQFSRVVTDDLIAKQVPKRLSADIESQAPVFRVKRVESSGSLTYTCVIATKTELWDIADIFTEMGQEDSKANPFENKDCQNLTTQVENSQTLQGTEPESDAKTPAINGLGIPEFQIRRFEETEVVVSHMVSPGNFFVQQADSVTKLQALVTDSWKASSSYAEQNCIPDIGTQVMGWFPKQEQWCRAQVTKICGVSGDNNASAGSETSIKVEVKRLDHGDTACMSLSNIKELTPEMAALPLQAAQVSLANVTPVNGSDWSEEAVGWFQAMVHNRTLYARFYPQGPKVTVELFLEKGKLGAMRRGASLSLRLAQNGHATHNRQRNNGLKKRSAVQVKMRQQDSEWEKYLISCYTQSKK